MTIRDAEDSYLSWLISAIVPWADAPEPQPLKPGTKAPPPVVCSVAREGIKAPNKVCDVMTASVKNLEEIRGLKDKFNVQQRQPQKKSEGDDATAPDTIGMAIRKWGPTWRNQALFVLLYEVLALPEGEQGEPQLAYILFNKWLTYTAEIISSYSKWFEHIQKLNLTEAYALKPLLDGKTLAKALETPPGPWMKSALDVVMAWQLRNPEVTDPAGAVEEVRIQRQTQETGSDTQQTGKKKGELTSHLASHFLQLTIRPLFAKTQNPAVTAQGRKSIQSSAPRAARLIHEDESETKPWKGEKEGYALELLRWVLLTVDAEGIEKIWPLVIPPIFALVDDSDPKFKAKGCDLLKLLVEITPPSLLSRTGLAQEFENSLFPCLTYLPSLTPEPESILLLNAAYPALISLAKIRYPVPPRSDPISEAFYKRAEALDRLIWGGILFAHAHSGDHVRIAQCLLTHLASIINELGIHSVKHLRTVVPLLRNTLSDPLGLAYPPLLIQASRTMQTMIVNSWMRMELWALDILEGSSVCWVRLAAEGETKDGFAELKAELRKVVDRLKKAIDDEEDVTWQAETRRMIEADARLEGLFA